MKATIKLCLGIDVEAIVEALQAEIGQPAPAKGSIEIARDGGCITLYIDSRELSGLRALASSYLYLIHAAYSAITASKL